MAAENPRKRLTPASTADDASTTDSTPERPSKRQRQDDHSLLTNGNRLPGSYLTPPHSARPTPRPTVSLALEIPEHVPDDKEKRQLASRKGAAKKWVPKLQNSFPDGKEVKKAYSLKLMRHYPLPTPAKPETDSTSASASTLTPPSATPSADANFIKPVIQKSSRVTNLLKSFPALSIPAPAPKTTARRIQEQKDRDILRSNREGTVSQEAVKLAWKSFAEPDYPRREVMVESALPIEELEKEYHGKANNLPEWKKHRTSKFLEERGKRRMR